MIDTLLEKIRLLEEYVNLLEECTKGQKQVIDAQATELKVWRDAYLPLDVR